MWEATAATCRGLQHDAQCIPALYVGSRAHLQAPWLYLNFLLSNALTYF